MTTDERLERLTGRHEALAESLRLLKATVDELTSAVQALAEVATAQIRDLSVVTQANGESFSHRIWMIANHQHRIGLLEGGNAAA